jgi:hypothetical protein
MKFIAKKPCNFGGKNYYIGDEIPTAFISEPKTQERLGVISILEIKEEVPDDDAGTFTWSEVEEKIAEAVKETEEKYREAEKQLEEARNFIDGIQEGVALEGETTVNDGVFNIELSTESDEKVSIPLTQAEIQQAVAIRQQNAENAIKAIADVTSENVLILIHALDERKTVKEAAKKRADLLPDDNISEGKTEEADA